MKYRNDKSGLLIFDKNTGFNILLDECQVDKIDKSPRHISFAITNACNLNCDHCYITQGINFIDKNELSKWIIELDSNGCLSIGIGGGEPTLHPDLLEILDIINHTKMAATITTNGSAKIDYYRIIINKVNLIRFSLDGFNDVYENIRKQNFDCLISKIKTLAKETKVGINYLLTDDTVNQLDMLKDLATEVKPEEILLLPYINKNKIVDLSHNSIVTTNQWLKKNKNHLPICLSYSALHTFDFEYLSVQEYNSNIQDEYFLHVTANKKLLRNVFSEEGIIVRDSLITAIEKLRGV